MTMPKLSPDVADGTEEQFPRLDHVGVLVRDLEQASAQWQSRFAVPITSTFEAPALNIRATFFNLGSAKIELYTIDEPKTLEYALGSAPAKIDHIALAFGASLSDADLNGCTIRGPGRPDPISSPFRIGSSDHIWTEPPGIDILLQLITPSDTA
ncbi:hypothetical protein [Nocardia speluncae]|uniref:hypothetical protein n=1 Tax=Nocardia speluncae TaxID=419477 RepID=UPI000ADAA614|nr:hypothetical protein [Nocardia speluncae]